MNAYTRLNEILAKAEAKTLPAANDTRALLEEQLRLYIDSRAKWYLGSLFPDAAGMDRTCAEVFVVGAAIEQELKDAGSSTTACSQAELANAVVNGLQKRFQAEGLRCSTPHRMFGQDQNLRIAVSWK